MKRTISILLALVICLVVAVAIWRQNSSKRTLSDGTVIILQGVKVGRTNIYSHGTWLAKTLGHFAPSNGISVGGFKWERPTKQIFRAGKESPNLTVQLRLLPGSPQEKTLLAPAFHRKFRLLISGQSDFSFVKEFDGFKRHADGLYAYVHASSFPRDSRQLHFRLEERDLSTTREWREMTTFVMRNPAAAQIKSWPADRNPRFQLTNDIYLEIGELVVRHEPIHPTDIWEYTASLSLRVIQNGQMLSNWGIHNSPIQDSSGNTEGFPTIKVVTNDWMIYRHFRPIDPSKLWRLQINVGLDSDFPSNNLFSFVIPRRLTGIIQTNLGPHEVKVGFVGGNTLSVELASKSTDTRLTFVTAKDEKGNVVSSNTGSWGQHHFWNHMNPSEVKEVHATVAIHPNFSREFTLQPRDETSPRQVKQEGAQPGRQAR